MANKINIQDEIRRITNELAAGAEKKALEVSSLAMARAAEIADLAKQKAAEVSAMAISKALDASTLAAEKAAQAAVAAAQVASVTSLDLTYIKKDIMETKLEIQSINDKLDNKYLSKEEFRPTKEVVDRIEGKYASKDEFSTMKTEIKSIQDNLSRAVWIVLGAVILAVLGVVIINK